MYQVIAKTQRYSKLWLKSLRVSRISRMGAEFKDFGFFLVFLPE